MKISIIQYDLVWEDKTSNFRKLSTLITPLFNQTDIVVLPEMFNTGFSINQKALAESPEAETFDWLADISRKGKFGICGSYIVKENGKYYNRWIFVTPEGNYWHYDKRHLFSMSGENKYFSSGKTRLVFSFRGVRISPFICYDLRFPVWSRIRNDCDLIIYVANWPESRQDIWDTLLKARAIENQCYVAGVNRTGTDGTGIAYCGGSVIVDPQGAILATADQNTEISVTSDISMAELSDLRKFFPFLRDADDFEIVF
jgi:omega-amidase